MAGFNPFIAEHGKEIPRKDQGSYELEGTRGVSRQSIFNNQHESASLLHVSGMAKPVCFHLDSH